MKTTAINLSAYKITWIEFRAQNGIVTKKDYMILAKCPDKWAGKHGTRFHEWFANREAAEQYLREHDFSKLGKAYEVRMMSDKQFSMGKNDFNYPMNDDRRMSFPFTAQQEREMFVIGK